MSKAKKEALEDVLSYISTFIKKLDYRQITTLEKDIEKFFQNKDLGMMWIVNNFGDIREKSIYIFKNPDDEAVEIADIERLLKTSTIENITTNAMEIIIRNDISLERKKYTNIEKRTFPRGKYLIKNHLCKIISTHNPN